MRRRKSVEKQPKHLMCAVPVDSRRLVTFEQGSRLWTDEGFDPGDLKGALARLFPPYDASDAKIAAAAQRLKEAGAAAVRPLPRPPAPKAFGAAAMEAAGGLAEGGAERQSASDVDAVIAALIEGSFAADKEALKQLIDKSVAASGREADVREHDAVDVGHLTAFRLENWKRFKGEHQVEGLEPVAYSITGERDGDAERSNYSGKSSIFEAIVFAITGRYSGKTADGWITHGEGKGGVDLEFANGLFVSRWKSRGQGTKLEVQMPDWTDADGELRPMTGDEAQRWIDAHVVDEDTLFKTGYFEQGKTDQFVKMGSAECSNVFNGWLGIEWLKRAADHRRYALNTLSEQAASETAIVQRVGEGADEKVRAAEAELKEKKDKRDEIKAKFEARKKIAEAGKEWEDHSDNALRHAAICEQLKTPLLGVDEQELQKAKEAVTEAAGEQRVRRLALTGAEKVAKGGFDGKCPVNGMKCPAQDQINEMGHAARAALNAAKTEFEQAKASADAASKRLANLNAAKMAHERAEGARDAMREELKKLAASAEWIAEHPPPPMEEEEDFVEKLQAASGAVVTAEHALAMAKLDLQVKAEAEEKLTALGPKVELNRAALQILGRSGAQRVVAEAALAQIEESGNAALRSEGFDLAFRIEWSRETKQPADDCDRCGAQFPRGARHRACARCGAPRGRKLSDELSLKPSERSGGADALIGVAFKLAAGKWLGRWRKTRWGVVMLDEPFGSLDPANVRRLAQHLTRMLGRQFGARQSFVVAHHADVLEAMPGRLHVKREGEQSSVERVTGAV